jgi:hypothetical protein
MVWHQRPGNSKPDTGAVPATAAPCASAEAPTGGRPERSSALPVFGLCFPMNMRAGGMAATYAVFLLPLSAAFGRDRGQLTSDAARFSHNRILTVTDRRSGTDTRRSPSATAPFAGAHSTKEVHPKSTGQWDQSVQLIREPYIRWPAKGELRLGERQENSRGIVRLGRAKCLRGGKPLKPHVCRARCPQRSCWL